MRALIFLAALALCSANLASAADPCKDTKSCMPTRDTYDINVDNVVAPLGTSHWVKCLGPYALCAFANCSILPDTEPPLAACGCYVPKKPVWFVTPRQLKSKQWYDATSTKCFQGDAFNNNNTGCLKTNSAPVCKAIIRNKIYNQDYDLISTFTPTVHLGRQSCIGPGLMAECMSAACYNKTAWDGSPVTCYCPVTNVPEGQAYSLGRHREDPAYPCNQPQGYIISGEYTNPQ